MEVRRSAGADGTAKPPAGGLGPLVEEADVLLVNGGDGLYLAHWMRESGVAELLPSLQRTVYVGLSGGSMALAPQIGEDFVQWRPPSGLDQALGLVEFVIFPHLNHPDLPEDTTADAANWAAGISVSGYAIDDDTAIRVVDGGVDVVSVGQWEHYPRP